ncbi:hypothetical protein B0J12DRAFT_417369 [Macrophomina phaseolina]|uniref:BAH domain-containing protein n=1 Tax=Macrophomina phaseolina TaxID=35725 RepID=A0ABQ8FU91_9PEZI|nr:hypothetical protein B0J12DRAFT_417369 [Macrophomina phaseolina]
MEENTDTELSSLFSEEEHMSLYGEMEHREEPQQITLHESTGTQDEEPEAPGKSSTPHLPTLRPRQGVDSRSPPAHSTASSTKHSRESDSDDEPASSRLPLEAKLYFIPQKENCSKGFSVRKYKNVDLPAWKLLPRKPSVLLRDVELRVGDLVEMRAFWDPKPVAEIAEICDLQNGRHMLRIFWFIKRLEAVERLPETVRIPESYRYIKTAHTQVVMWDTVARPLHEKEQMGCKTDQVLLYTKKGHELFHADSRPVRWTKVERM